MEVLDISVDQKVSRMAVLTSVFPLGAMCGALLCLGLSPVHSKR